jgi:hypothetical protein
MINRFLGIEDQFSIENTCKDTQQFQMDFVYPMTKTLDVQTLSDRTRTRRWVTRYLEKVQQHVRVLEPCYNHAYVPPTIEHLPNLREVTVAVPLILDATRQSVHPTTQIAWGELNRFLRSLTIHPNQLETLRIVPGIIKMVRTDLDTNAILDQHIVDDIEEGSHLRLYRVFDLPIVLYGLNAENLQGKTIHAPSSLMALSLRHAMKNCKGYTDWSGHTQGHASILFDLFAF